MYIIMNNLKYCIKSYVQSVSGEAVILLFLDSFFSFYFGDASIIITKTSINVLPSKNQVLCAILAFIKSCEKGLITKEYLVTDTHLNFAFKRALHYSTLVIKLFNSATILF